mmetsp:Transcript_29380/g.87886  ORF Transcript_29380/g.87886 Transcript_29380/m.87886 type:complete len:231 (+) Transcript_29380:453-1145(+)
MRCSADEKWKRFRIVTLAGPRFLSAGGVATDVLASYVQPSARTAVSSMGSPTSFDPSAATSEWHAASTTAASLEASLISRVFLGLASEPAPSAHTTPWGTSLSVVSVPVLSKRQWRRRPAKGTRKGSVAMTPAFIRAISAVFTARAICMGSWRGTTEVTMMTQRRSSSCVVRSPFLRPSRKTYAAATSAKIKRMPRAPSVSRVSELTVCCENSIICMSSPWAEPKPVRST